MQPAAPPPTPPTAAAAAPDRAPPGPARPPRPETRRAYAADLRQFFTWCAGNDRCPLPASPDTVAAWLASLADTAGAGTLRRKRAALAQAHRAAGVALEVDPAVRDLLRAARRLASRRPARPPPAQLERLAVTCPRDLAGRRDRALLLLRAHGLGRAALVGLTAEQIRWTTAGMELVVSPRHPELPPRRVAIPRGPGVACPVRALEEWMHASECRFGPVFRKIDRWGNVEFSALNIDALRRVLRRRRCPRGPATAPRRPGA